MKVVKVGDVVRLKSGGPRMTVSVVMPTAVIAHWFDRAVLNTDRFSKQELSGEQSQQSPKSFTREPKKAKAELYEMLAEAVRNTAQPEPEPRRKPKEIAAKGGLTQI